MVKCTRLDPFGSYAIKAAYADSRFRPLALRRLITRRPALVDILFRNPCLRDRFILLG
jgi:hypothetical protein